MSETIFWWEGSNLYFFPMQIIAHVYRDDFELEENINKVICIPPRGAWMAITLSLCLLLHLRLLHLSKWATAYGTFGRTCWPLYPSLLWSFEGVWSSASPPHSKREGMFLIKGATKRLCRHIEQGISWDASWPAEAVVFVKKVGTLTFLKSGFVDPSVIRVGQP